MAKCLDHFLVTECFVESVELIRQCEENGGDSNHFPIMLEFLGGGRNTCSPFKFIPRWLDDNYFGELVKAEWVPCVLGRDQYAGKHFMKNLCRVKKVSIIWARLKQEREATGLRDCESTLRTIMEGAGGGFGFGSVDTKDEVILLEGRRRKILCEMEAFGG